MAGAVGPWQDAAAAETAFWRSFGGGSGAGRGVSTQAFVEPECRPAVARCMAALTFAADPDPEHDPAALGAAMATCSKKQCECAGAPASYSPATETCTVGENLFDHQFTDARGATVFPYATCDQVAGCLVGTCEVDAWVKYTPEDNAACNAMWHCMNRAARGAADACASSVVRAGGAVCEQQAQCARLNAVAAAIPAGAPDCEAEYARVMADPAAQNQIEETCAGVACSCLRRGSVGVCDGATSCCISGAKWDAFHLSENGLAYHSLTCGEAELCAPAAAYCKLVSEPDKRLPEACRGYSHGRYTDGRARPDACFVPSHTVWGRDEATADGHAVCARATTNPCTMVKSAAVARCNTPPRLYQTCPAETTPDAAGRCACNSIAGHTAMCTAGVCVFTPVECTTDASCSGHAVSAALNATADGCDCVCEPRWTGARCDISEGEGEADWDPLLVGVVGGAAALVVLAAALAFVVCRGRRAQRGDAPTRRAPSLEQSFLRGNEDEDEESVPGKGCPTAMELSTLPSSTVGSILVNGDMKPKQDRPAKHVVVSCAGTTVESVGTSATWATAASQAEPAERRCSFDIGPVAAADWRAFTSVSATAPPRNTPEADAPLGLPADDEPPQPQQPPLEQKSAKAPPPSAASEPPGPKPFVTSGTALATRGRRGSLSVVQGAGASVAKPAAAAAAEKEGPVDVPVTTCGRSRSTRARRRSSSAAALLKRSRSDGGVRLLQDCAPQAPLLRSGSGDSLGMSVTIRPVKSSGAVPDALSKKVEIRTRRSSAVEATKRQPKLLDTLAALRSSGALATAKRPPASLQGQARRRDSDRITSPLAWGVE
eukprot:TRINITY_DN2909_c1_g1_i1.p1 TRINITY_DN2909_c1_g1~~TRINITY_DN2909_c1_g1_i1.p1  ORF type:complete len:864 (+),score=203.88 TRINITY_DN2909_c1_g1_i1:99-2594(+)